MTRYAMIIDLHRCVGCGGCEITCKVENQVPEGVHLGYHTSEMSGEFPHPAYTYRPVMCKHLVYYGLNPRCVDACPADARIFGDEKDIYGDIHETLLEFEGSVLKPEAGTESHVYYIREFEKTW